MVQPKEEERAHPSPNPVRTDVERKKSQHKNSDILSKLEYLGSETRLGMSKRGLIGEMHVKCKHRASIETTAFISQTIIHTPTFNYV